MVKGRLYAKATFDFKCQYDSLQIGHLQRFDVLMVLYGELSGKSILHKLAKIRLLQVMRSENVEIRLFLLKLRREVVH